jgi:hypothetical protein
MLSRMRKLAAAFIVTTSLVACNHDHVHKNPPEHPPHKNPPEPTTEPTQARPVDERGVPLDLRADEVTRQPDGQCLYTPPVNCPPPDEATCNPPPPIPVECPAQ